MVVHALGLETVEEALRHGVIEAGAGATGARDETAIEQLLDAGGEVLAACLSVPLRHRGLTVPTRRFITSARMMGCPAHVWTVNEPATARRLWARGVAGVVTDVPASCARPGKSEGPAGAGPSGYG